MTRGDYVEVHRGTGKGAVAHVIEDALAAQGIPCLIETHDPIPAGILGMLPPTFTVLVRREHAQRATRVLADVSEPDDSSEYDDLPRRLRPRRPANPAPFPVIGSIAVLILGAGLFDLSQGGGLWLLLLPLSGFALVVAFRSRH